GTVLSDYTSSYVCTKNGNPYLSGSGASVGADAEGDVEGVVCTFTNTRNTGSIEVKKTLSPASDPGRFDLAVDGVPGVTNVGNGGDTGAITVNTGTAHTAAESAHAGTVLGDYTSSYVCTKNGNPYLSGSGASVG